MKAVINESLCTGCGICVRECLMNRLELTGGKSTVNDQVCIGCGHCMAACPCGAVSFTDADMSEVLDFSDNVPRLDPEELLNSMKFRRSMRNFTDAPVEDGLINRLLEAGRYAPTASNLQRIRYVVIREKLPGITELALRVLYDTAQDEERFRACGSQSFYRQKWIRMYEDYINNGADGMFYHAPCVILIIDTSRPHDRSGTISSGLAAANMEQMANACGLGACYIGFLLRAAALDESLKEALGLKPEEELNAVLAVGHPDVKYYRTVLRKKAKVTWM